MSTAKSSIPVWAALLGSGAAGMMVGAQSRINGGLSQALHNGYLAALVSFGSGLLLLCVAMLLSRRARAGWGSLTAELRSGRFPVWGLFGGACGAFFVLTQGLVASAIGLALFTVGIVAGQVVGGLVLDRIGLGPGGRVSPTLPRVIGTALAVVAVAASVWSDFASDGGSGDALWLVVLPLIAGMGMAWQSAVNGIVRVASRSAITATFLNFVVGTAVLAVCAVVSVLVSGWPSAWPGNPVLYLGGGMGVIFIALASVLVRTAGVLLLSMSNVAGQLIASVAFEIGLPLAGGVTWGLLAGSAIALVAVIVAALPARAR